jgi:yeast amino acid transporter
MSLFRRMLASFAEEKDENDADGQPIEILKRDLKGYHIQMIALGSAIGTGLFIGSGEALAMSGPVPVLFAFIFVGAALCPTIFALGEIATLDPDTGGFFEHCRKYTDEAWGGAMGWKYMFSTLSKVMIINMSVVVTFSSGS